MNRPRSRNPAALSGSATTASAMSCNAARSASGPPSASACLASLMRMSALEGQPPIDRSGLRPSNTAASVIARVSQMANPAAATTSAIWRRRLTLLGGMFLSGVAGLAVDRRAVAVAVAVLVAVAEAHALGIELRQHD